MQWRWPFGCQQIQTNNCCHYYQQSNEDMRDRAEEELTEKILVSHILFPMKRNES
jgi:hypothetical protein